LNPLLSALLRVLLFCLGLAVSFLPRRAELWLGPRLGRLALLLDPIRKKIALENIRRCLPELGCEGWDRLLRENYEHYGMLALELLHMFSPSPGHYRRYCGRVARLENFENWQRANAKGKGVLCFSAHLANWELMAAVGAMAGIPSTIITRHLKPEWLHKKIESARLSVGVRCAYQPRTLPQVMRALRKGESIGFVLDQYASPPMGVPVAFFGAKVHTLAALSPLAQRTGAAILPMLQRRGSDGIVHVVMEPELDLGEDLADSVRSTERLAAKVEGWIRDNPAQWLWGHRRFKHAVWPQRPAQPKA